jgi:chorismate synthase
LKWNERLREINFWINFRCSRKKKIKEVRRKGHFDFDFDFQPLTKGDEGMTPEVRSSYRGQTWAWVWGGVIDTGIMRQNRVEIRYQLRRISRSIGEKWAN